MDILTRKEEKDDEFYPGFVYPLIGFVTVAAFRRAVHSEGV